MAALPSTRPTPSDPPFAVTGIDFLRAISRLSARFEGLKGFVPLPPTRVVLELREEVQRAIGETFKTLQRKFFKLLLTWVNISEERDDMQGQAIVDSIKLWCNVNFSLTCLRRKNVLKATDPNYVDLLKSYLRIQPFTSSFQ